MFIVIVFHLMRRCYILSEIFNFYKKNHCISLNNYLCTSCFHKPLERMEGSVLSGRTDKHRGIIIDSNNISCEDSNDFESKLKTSLDKWVGDKIRGVWFNIGLSQLSWIPILIQNGFKIHHARDELITLCRWLPEGEPDKLPDYAHYMVGAGAVVLNDKNQILVVRERYGGYHFWKLPGGHSDMCEDIAETAIREVLEETSIKTEFVSVVAFRRSERATFPKCSDLYFVARLRPLTFEITKEEDEIDDCTWMDIDVYLNHPDVHENNRFFVRQALQNEKDGIVIKRIQDIHPVAKVPQQIYVLSKIDRESS